MPNTRWPAVLVDAALVLVFAAVGRSSHEEGSSLGGLATTAWPFLAGLAVAWVVATVLTARTARTDDDPLAVLPWMWTVPVVTWAVGMGLRVVSGQGTSGAFPLVALGFLVLALLGWRLLAVAARSAIRRAGPRRSAARAPETPGHGG